jgi:hypothetical protein
MSKLPYNMRPGAKKNPDEAKKNVTSYNGYWNNLGGSSQSSTNSSTKNATVNNRSSVSANERRQPQPSGTRKQTKSVTYDGTGDDLRSSNQRNEQKQRRTAAGQKTHTDAQLTAAAKRVNDKEDAARAKRIEKNQKRNEYRVSQQNNSVGYQNMMYRKTMAQMNKAKEKLYEDQLNPKKKKGK